MIRASFTAVPKRLPVLWGKAIVFASVTFALMLPAVLIAFFASQSILSRHHANVAFSDPHVARAVIGAALYLTVIALFSLGARRDHPQHGRRDRRVRGDPLRDPAADERAAAELERCGVALSAEQRRPGDPRDHARLGQPLTVGRLRGPLRVRRRDSRRRGDPGRSPRHVEKRELPGLDSNQQHFG